MRPSRFSNSRGDKGAAKTLLDNRSRTKLRNPTISRVAGPKIKTQVSNRRICDNPSCDSDEHELWIILALIKKGTLVHAYSVLIKSAVAMAGAVDG
jgi:hypothetical protein